MACKLSTTLMVNLMSCLWWTYGLTAIFNSILNYKGFTVKHQAFKCLKTWRWTFLHEVAVLVKLPNKRGLDILNFDNILLKVAVPIVLKISTLYF